MCLLIGQLGIGGTEKQLTLLARGLRERGIATTVLVMFEDGPYLGVLQRAGIPVVSLGFLRGSAGWRMAAGNVAAFARLVVRLRRQRPDVLHAFLFHGYVTAAPAARLAGVPVLVAGHRGLIDYRGAHRLPLILGRAATRLTDLVVANAQAVAEDSRHNQKIGRDKIAVVPNGLPRSAFDRVPPAPVPSERPIVLCVANLRAYKGHRHLLDAIAHLANRGLPCTLVLAGDGPERASLNAQAGRLGIDVRFLGLRTDVERLLARADIVALPSLEEGMSNALMEAMAAGLPIVATDVGGNGELLHNRGLLVPPADARALADGIALLLTDVSLARRLGARAREWSRAHLMADTMVDRHLSIYRRLLERA